MVEAHDKKRVIVIGGGAAGMFAAIHAARAGADVTLLEKNGKLGKKIYITGKGRCNLTNHSSREQLQAAVSGRQGRFLYSAFSQWDADDTIRFFEEAGLRLKEERGRRMFPVSDHASDVTKTLEREMHRLAVDIRLNTEVIDVRKDLSVITGEETLRADSVVIATGGLSYPSTGSTGDGYRFSQNTGHTVNALSPSLVPMNAEESWVRELQGLTLKNVGIRFSSKDKVVYREKVGELLFTHFGISGPAVLTASSRLTEILYPSGHVEVQIDLKPALSGQELDRRLIRELEGHHRQDFINAVRDLFPKKLIPVIVALSGIDPEKKADQITSSERKSFVHLIKHLTLHVTGLRGWDEAVITHGGVDTKQIDPKTMESKLTAGLFFAGEILDADALTGGYNLQIAWSTGYVAGTAAAAI